MPELGRQAAPLSLWKFAIPQNDYTTSHSRGDADGGVVERISCRVDVGRNDVRDETRRDESLHRPRNCVSELRDGRGEREREREAWAR